MIVATKKKRKKSNKANGRDYTYDKKYQASKKQKKRRAARNKSRAQAIKNGTVKKGDGKDIDHKDGNPLNNSTKNKQAIPKGKNRAKNKPGQKK